jgi:predicted ATPase
MGFRLTPQVLSFLRIPKNLWGATMADVPNKCPHKKLVSAYLDDIVANVESGQGLYLWGDYGRGKSALAAMTLKAAAIQRKLGLWIRAKDLPEYIINDTPFVEEQTMLERAKECCILVIDEFQVRKNIGFYETAIEDLLRGRIADGKTTIVTSNIVPKELSETYPPLYSVLQESLYPIKVSGHDFRAEKKGQVNG